jgi:hypothetical protein
MVCFKTGLCGLVGKMLLLLQFQILILIFLLVYLLNPTEFGEMATDGDTKENGSTVKASLEKEISRLKFEIVSLQQKLERNLKEKSEETKLLQDQASGREKEINELRDLLKKETLRADSSEEESFFFFFLATR